MEAKCSRFVGLRIVFWLCVIQQAAGAATRDAAALLAFKASADPGHMLDSGWRSLDHCQWEGVKECINDRVTKLVVEHLGLNGTFAGNTLSRLDQLRVLSLKGNALAGSIPDLSGLRNLKSMFLNENKFTGPFPASLSGLHRLKVVVLGDNSMSGEIPVSVVRLQRLYVLRLENNRFSGRIPPFNQSTLGIFNVSNNKLSGRIPRTVALSAFNFSSFVGNPGLCGRPLPVSCAVVAPAGSPGQIALQGQNSLPAGKVGRSKHLSRGAIAAIVVGTSVGLASVVLIMVLLGRRRDREDTNRAAGENQRRVQEKPEARSDERSATSPYDPHAGSGSLAFCGGRSQTYSLEDLLRASAEILGRGTLGSTYRAVMASGLVVTVKRLKNSSNQASRDEFDRHMEMLGSLRHPNVVSLRAYFQAREERLVVYDYHSNGSLFALVHGTRSSGGSKPLHWTSCLKIAEDVAQGMAFLHRDTIFVHGNLKPSNVLIGSDFEACITDYGLAVLDLDPQQTEDDVYRAPEWNSTRRFDTKTDVYSFGVLVLEILAGKTPLRSMVISGSSDLGSWVRSAREEEETEGDSLSAGEGGSEDRLTMLLNIAVACASPSPDLRPTMTEVLRMIQEAREATASSPLSSDHSPARWSDTVHGVPGDQHGTDRTLTERD